jgi:CHAD domain-containing protein
LSPNPPRSHRVPPAVAHPKAASGLEAPALAGPSPGGVPLRLDDPLSAAAAKVIGFQLLRLREHDPGTRTGEDPETLHDMRVASRRLRAAVGHFRRGIPEPSRARLARELRWLGTLLGAVRDLDVQRERLERAAAPRPARERRVLAHLTAAFADERRSARERLLAGLQSPRYFRLLTELERFTGDAGAGEETVATEASRSVRRALRRFERAAEAALEVPGPERLHVLRIAAKRLRYLLEFLEEVLGAAARRPLKRLVGLQDLLGAHQDAIVAADRILEYLASASAPTGMAERACLEAAAGREHLLARQIRRAAPAALRPLCGGRGAKWRARLLEALPPAPVPGRAAKERGRTR